MTVTESTELLERRFIRAAAVFLAATCLVMFFGRGFIDPDEGRYAEVPREMVSAGNWGEMRMLGYRYYEKPPLAYWLVAPAIRILGAHDWAVRVPLLAAFLVTLGLALRLTRGHWPDAQRRQAVLTMIATIGVLAGAGMLMTDPFLAMWFFVTCAAIFNALQPGTAAGRRWALLMVAGIAAALGFLTKGAVAIVLPALIALLWLMWERRPAALFTPAVFAAAAACLAIVIPALIGIEQFNPGFIEQFIMEEHLARFRGTRAMQGREEVWYFFLYVLPALMAPWTLFLFRAARNIWKRNALKNDSLSRFLLVWAAIVIGFFSASTGKLMSYILPALPAVMLLAARWGVAEKLDERDAWDNRLWRVGCAGTILVSAAIPVLWAVSHFQMFPGKIYAASLESALSFLPLAFALAWVFATGGFRTFGGVLLANSGIVLAGALLLSPLAGKDFNVLIHINSSHVFKSLARTLGPDDAVVVFWDYRPALPFYLQRLYTPYQVKNELQYGMMLEPERRQDLQNPGELKDMIAGVRGRVFGVIAPHNYEKRFKPLQIPHLQTDLPTDPDTIIVELARPGR